MKANERRHGHLRLDPQWHVLTLFLINRTALLWVFLELCVLSIFWEDCIWSHNCPAVNGPPSVKTALHGLTGVVPLTENWLTESKSPWLVWFCPLRMNREKSPEGNWPLKCESIGLLPSRPMPVRNTASLSDFAVLYASLGMHVPLIIFLI